MSPIRYQGRHRKPRSSRAGSLIRGGVLTGVVGSVAVTGATTPASADEKPTESTGELPTLDTVLAHSATRAAEATEAYVSETQIQNEWQQAQDRAVAQAREAAAERRAEQEAAERRAREREEREAAAARAQEAATATTSAAPAASPVSGGSGAAIVNFVRAQLGDAYALGATGDSAWDCSSLVQAAYATVGVSLPRVAASQSTAGTQVSLDALQPGDILYWGGLGSAYHVAIYTGNGTFIGAQNPSTGVAERDLGWDSPSGAIRVL
ncbi:C40 family peptidase [Streptomyces sp. NBC_01803]|uniref:C40 family peptidase n=1 Tax=Streptomyces sp. NBC_01803 TaxID=2975946 RepID=UPI002DDA9F88|nr:C40 family peptidase [Streptomyces sp. NBC_01803]WSA45703.1 C40 family peptidase [Streptomyces sp. NBC_01803]